MGNNLNEISSDNHEKAVLAGVLDTSKRNSENEIENSIVELALLAKTAGAIVVGAVIQRRRGFDNATFVGKGKLEEIRNACEQLGAEVIIFDDELSGSQIRNIEQATGRKVIDRSLLILDIFAQRAQSKEGKLQVELAQQKYRYSRLIGFGVSLSRLGGGIGTRGPGESKLETDRRHIKRRIDFLKASLAEVGERRDRIREKRRDSDVITIAVVGYTNAGKSTLINRLCQSDLFVKDMLFATLDSAARKIVLPDGLSAMLIDTVGFIRKLPHHLIDAFKSTLEELSAADLILHVVDSSDEDLKRHMEIVEDLLSQLEASDKPRITVFNKSDVRSGIGSNAFQKHLENNDYKAFANTLSNFESIESFAAGKIISNETKKEKDLTANSKLKEESTKSDLENLIPVMFMTVDNDDNADNAGNDNKFDFDDNADNAGNDNNFDFDENANNLDNDYSDDNVGNDDKDDKDNNSDNDREDLADDFQSDELDSSQDLAQLTGRSYETPHFDLNSKDGEIMHVSAVTGDGIESLLEIITQKVRNARTAINIFVPYKDAGVLDFIRKNGSIEKLDYKDDGIYATIRLPSSKIAHINAFVVK